MIHENSVKSYEEQKEKGLIESWRRIVFDAYCMKPFNSLTDREVLSKLGNPDVNLVRPEITRLISDGLLKPVGKTICSFTGKTVRHCTWTGKLYFMRGNKKAATV
jgi:hypothetical protein